ncbi:hypothetical protein CK203_116674 [Vitis vinifera]|uniref:Retrotransposon gag domain-containing protein n=1 Tax=Vitis vinifera TaxID=29760 RepID=A0A438CAB9_VITVI|nr:hypothetical protein CK203_116674 [Vitis vinifera]
MGTRPSHCRFQGAPYMTLPHHHHHHHHLSHWTYYTAGLHSSTTTTTTTVQSAPQARAFVLHGQTETTPHSVMAPAQIVDDTQALAALPVEFRMPDIERYTRIGCPRIHLHGAAQRWFASLDPSRRRTWADLGQEFIRQYSFNTIVDVSRRELEALKQGPDETVTSFISRWREKIAQIIDRPSERDQISMIMHSLQPRFARHLMGFPQTDFGSLVQALYGIEEGISRGHRSSRRPPFQSQFLGTPYQMIQHDHHYSLPPGFRTDLHCAYHQRAGHDTDSCSALRHAIQDLIDQGLVDLGRPGVATDPLHTHDTRAVPPLRKRIYGLPLVSPVYLQHVPPMTPFILFPEEYRPPHRDVQIVTRSGRVAQPPPVDRPFAGIAAREEVQREDDEILRQLRTTQARISIWSLWPHLVHTEMH